MLCIGDLSDSKRGALAPCDLNRRQPPCLHGVIALAGLLHMAVARLAARRQSAGHKFTIRFAWAFREVGEVPLAECQSYACVHGPSV